MWGSEALGGAELRALKACEGVEFQKPSKSQPGFRSREFMCKENLAPDVKGETSVFRQPSEPSG